VAAVAAIVLYDAVVMGVRGGRHRSGEPRPSRLQALVIAVLTATLAAGLVLSLVVFASSPRAPSDPTSSPGGAGATD
jgi:hypothetical protein